MPHVPGHFSANDLPPKKKRPTSGISRAASTNVSYSTVGSAYPAKNQNPIGQTGYDRRLSQMVSGTDDAGLGTPGVMPATATSATAASSTPTSELVKESSLGTEGPTSFSTPQYSPHGKMMPGADYNSADRLVSPNVLAQQRAQDASTGLPAGIRRNDYRQPGVLLSGNDFTNVPQGSYGGNTPLTANYDRAGEAALVQGRRDATRAFIEGGRGDRREANLRRRANARLSGNMGIVDFVTAAANRKNARDELTQLIEERGKDRRSLLDAETSMRNTDVAQEGQTQRTLISEAGDTSRAQAKAQADASLEAFKQSKTDIREFAKLNVKMGIEQFKAQSELLVKEIGGNRALIERVSEQQGKDESQLLKYVADLIPQMQQERDRANEIRAKKGKPLLPPLTSDPNALPPDLLVNALASAPEFDRRRNAPWYSPETAITGGEAMNETVRKGYFTGFRHDQD